MFAARKRFRACPSVVRVFCFASDFLVCESTPNDLLHDNCEPFGISELARVESKYLFIDVPEQVERLDTDVRSVQSALQQAPEVFHAVRMDLSLDIGFRVIDNLVRVILAQSKVGNHFVRVQMGTRFNVLMNGRDHAQILRVLDHASTDFAATLQHALNCRLADRAAAFAFHQAALAALVHIASLSADVALVYLDLPRELAKRPVLHRQPNSLQHEPRRLLSNAQIPVKLVRTDTVFAANQHPCCRKPLLKRNRRVLKNRSGLQRKRRSRMIGVALPNPPLFQPRNVFRSAGRAGYLAVWPAQLRHEATAVLEVGEVQNRIPQSGFAFHASSMRLIPWDVKYIIATSAV